MKYLLGTLLLCATSALAGGFDYTSSDGTTYELINTYLGEIGVMNNDMPEDTYLLLRNCQARHETYGTGSWKAAKGGWLIEYPDFRIVFPNQEPPPVDTKRCGLT